ncbi:hypothetical protein M0812_12548 [Anaeramoeba flamelloides]|uniref:Uncharacterized protein n=1 Tax=Anaeramoeba flamelloides TaxID=1746091 RepID=A0AAV7ZLB5_9EUKA|nr:hypothetical protein M0812_12548 [Anaeramoeba flamelloides]
MEIDQALIEIEFRKHLITKSQSENDFLYTIRRFEELEDFKNVFESKSLDHESQNEKETEFLNQTNQPYQTETPNINVVLIPKYEEKSNQKGKQHSKIVCKWKKVPNNPGLYSHFTTLDKVGTYEIHSFVNNQKISMDKNTKIIKVIQEICPKKTQIIIPEFFQKDEIGYIEIIPKDANGKSINFKKLNFGLIIEPQDSFKIYKLENNPKQSLKYLLLPPFRNGVSTLKLYSDNNQILSKKFNLRLKRNRILLLGSARRGLKRLEHLKQSIIGGFRATVDILDISKQTPRFETMNRYDTIVLRGKNSGAIDDPVTLGNHLARFVEYGKGVIVIAINTLIDNDYKIKGRIVEDGFIPLVIANRVDSKQRQLGKIHLPNHPIMKGVQTFKTKDYTHIIGTHDLNGGTLIASWNNGYPLVTEKRKKESYGSVICLNFHPMSTKITDDCGKAWLKETDGAKIISNSVQYVYY